MKQQALVTKGTRSQDLSQGLGSRGMNRVQSVVYEEAQPFSDFTLGGGCSWGHSLGKLTQVSLG